MNQYWNFIKNILFLTVSFIFITSCFFSCSKDGDDNNNSTEICQAILDENQTTMKTLMEALTVDLNPVSTATDQLGHEANYNDLISQLNDFSCMEASGICYACIFTFPAQSEIRVIVDLNGAQIERVMDISTPEDGPLSYVRLHE